MMLKNPLIILLNERMEELQVLQENYDKESPEWELADKSDAMEELNVKVQLIVSIILKVIRNLNANLEEGNYMYRSDVERALQELREQLKNFNGMAWSYAEVLRSFRIKLENQYELSKLNMSRT